nr:MAG TPA: hypothetical protein [Caudoviricetes sp.]
MYSLCEIVNRYKFLFSLFIIFLKKCCCILEERMLYVYTF